MVAYTCNYRCLPRGLVTLQEWLTEDVPSDWWVQHGVSCSFLFSSRMSRRLAGHNLGMILRTFTLTSVFVSFANFII